MGRHNAYPPEVHAFVKANMHFMPDRVLAEECNKLLGTSFTANGMKSFRSNHKYYHGQKRQWDLDDYAVYNTHYPKGLIEFVRTNTEGVSARELAEMVNRKFGTHHTKGSIGQLRRKWGIKSGLTGQFQKGRKCETKGKRQADYITDPDALQRTVATRFKPGARPANELPLGSIVENRDGYLMKKVSMTGGQWERWAFLHRLVWEEHNGPISEGMFVTFKDSDRKNCSPENLMLVSMAENAALTGLHYRFEYPELTETALNVIRLDQSRRHRKHGKQDVS